MQTPTRILALAAVLAGCAKLPVSVTGGDYSCRMEEQGRQAARYVVAVASRGETLQISIDRMPKQMLARVPGSPSSLFSNEDYAWQVSPAGARLTDIGKVQTYACAVVLHAGEASGTGAPITGDADQRIWMSGHARGFSLLQ